MNEAETRAGHLDPALNAAGCPLSLVGITLDSGRDALCTACGGTPQLRSQGREGGRVPFPLMGGGIPLAKGFPIDLDDLAMLVAFPDGDLMSGVSPSLGW